MKLILEKRTCSETPYIDDYDCDILDDEGNLAGKRAFSLIRIQNMIADEVGIAESLQSVTDYGYLEKIFGQDFIYGRTGKLTPLAQILHKNRNYNVLILKSLEILPEYRRKGYGKNADLEVHRIFKGQYGMVIKKASPLQFDQFALEYDPAWAKRMGYDNMKGDRSTDTDLLIRKYESWGYTRIKNTCFLYMDPNNSQES